jgi:hypothetical protein
MADPDGWEEQGRRQRALDGALDRRPQRGDSGDPVLRLTVGAGTWEGLELEVEAMRCGLVAGRVGLDAHEHRQPIEGQGDARRGLTLRILCRNEGGDALTCKTRYDQRLASLAHACLVWLLRSKQSLG